MSSGPSSEPPTGALAPADRDLLLSLIRDVPDWPEPGVVYKDITPLLRDADGFATAIELIAEFGRHPGGDAAAVDVVAGVEARGFILGAPVADRLGVGFVPIRKAGKLPLAAGAASYALEYGEATVELNRDAFAPGDRVLVVDDVLATGGTMRATVDLIRASGAVTAGVSVLLELGFLHGRAKLEDVTVNALLSV
jgi:adenine phosphoribosyltransferase